MFKSLKKFQRPLNSISLIQNISSHWFVFSLDISITLTSIFLAFLLRFNFNLTSDTGHSISDVILIVLSVRILIFLVSRLFDSIVRYTSTIDVFKIVLFNAAGTFFLALLNPVLFLFQKSYPIPFTVIGIEFFTTTFFMIFYRLSVKILYIEITQSSLPVVRTIIYGSKEKALIAKKSLEMDRKVKYKIIAFISTLACTTGKILDGIPVFSAEEFEKTIAKHRVNQLVLASTKSNPQVEDELIQTCLNEKVKVFKMPDTDLWMSKLSPNKKILELNIEDLLSREPIILSKTAIRTKLADKTILVTGAAGSIGSEIVRQINQFSFKRLIMLDQAETPLYELENEIRALGTGNAYEFVVADITSKPTMDRIFKQFKPEIVYHVAAYKHVPMMESNPIEAIRNNVFGTKILADLASAYKVSKFIFISTDKAVNPTNVMGASKRIAEMYIQSLNKYSSTGFITTRFGNVLGSNGSVIPLFKKQIESGGPVTITHPEVTRFFMTIPEASQLVLEASVYGSGGEIFMFNMGKSVKILDLAKNMIKLAGLEPYLDIQIQFTGLRAGEKLFEELLHQSENCIETHHPKILIAKIIENDFAEVKKWISKLEEALFTQNNLLVVKEMKIMVPEYISQNSVFEDIDKEIQYLSKVS